MDDLREALSAAVEEHDEPEQELQVETAPASEPAEAPAEVEQDSEKLAEPAGEKQPPANDAVEQKAPVQAEEPKGVHRVDRAPNSWRKEAKGEWAAIPLHVRQEVHKREMEINRVLQETAPIRQEVEQFRQVAAPYMARMSSMGVQPAQAFESLLKADYVLSSSPKEQRAAYMAQLIKQYDIDIVALDKAIVGGQQPQTQQQGPDINALVQQQVQQALAPIYQQQQAQQQAQQQEVVSTVEQMSLDPRFPHFDEVRDDMADIIELNARRGVAISLETAYSRATQWNPQVSAMSQATQQNQLAQKAKAAAVSISGAPALGGAQVQGGDGTLRGDILAAFGGGRL